MKFSVKSSQRGPRIEAFRLVAASVPTTIGQSSTGCPEGFARCTVIKNGTGDFSITLNEPSKRTLIATASALHATSKLFATLVSATSSTVRFAVFSDAGTATDPTGLHVQVVAHETSDQI